MRRYSILAILFVLLSTAVIVSCHKETASFSSLTENRYATPPLANNINSDLSPVSSKDRVFYFLNSSTYPINCNNTYCTVRSRFILHNDGAFLLQYNYDGGNEYRRGIQYKGRYTQTNNSVSFTWEGWSVAGPWGATGTLREDTLTVGYNTIMSLSDFEDAVYLRTR
jgi:hypothetical protein